MLSFFCFVFPARPLTVYKHFVFFVFCFFSGVQKKIKQHKRVKQWECLKRRKKRTNASIFFFKKVQHVTSQNEDFLCYFQNSGIEQCFLVLFNLLCSVLMLILWTIWSRMFFVLFLVFFVYYIYFPLYKKKKWKKDIIAHYLAHTRKSGSCLRKARVPEYQLHAILMYIFMMS